MNAYQGLWWRQARSDHAAFSLLRAQGVAPCHQLHYLQMVSEKLAKAYFWRSGEAPRRSHAGLPQLLRALGGVERARRQVIAEVFSFRRFEDFQNWSRTALPLAYELERLAPDLAQDGPNPEYPWPHDAPRHAPESFDFDVWRKLTDTGQGRQLIQMIQVAVAQFSVFG